MRTKAVLAIIVVAAGVTAFGLVARKAEQTSMIDPGGNESNSAGPRVPVLVELFTSEGCSSCPPADALLSRFDKDQPVPGAEVIALSEHVDYWNRLGWNDPYSSNVFSNRQNEYSSAFNTDEVYTPQMIVDGHVQFVGSNESKAREAIADAARDAKAKVVITLDGTNSTSSVKLVISVEPLSNVTSDRVDVMLAIAESGLRSNVERGENAGRVLKHVAVVHKLSTLGTIASGKDATFNAQASVQISGDWKRENLKAVVFVQEHTGRQVLGVGTLPLRSSHPEH